MKYHILMLTAAISLAWTAGLQAAEPVRIPADRDTFGRSNERTRNSGSSPVLYMAHAPNIRSIIAFDLSSVTNQIISAQLRMRPADTVSDPIMITIAPMVRTEKNNAWGEGQGVLGAKGQNARPGEASYGWSAFPDVQWEESPGKKVTDLGDADLWSAPIISRQRLAWQEGQWHEIELDSVALLEEIRKADEPILTLGMWGTSGNGMYGICSRETGKGPELILTVQ